MTKREMLDTLYSLVDPLRRYRSELTTKADKVWDSENQKEYASFVVEVEKLGNAQKQLERLIDDVESLAI